MKCAICKNEIEVVGTWTEGHNAEPVVENGRCCGNCNDTKVIPARLRGLGLQIDRPAWDEAMDKDSSKRLTQSLVESVLETATRGMTGDQKDRAMRMMSPIWRLK